MPVVSGYRRAKCVLCELFALERCPTDKTDRPSISFLPKAPPYDVYVALKNVAAAFVYEGGECSPRRRKVGVDQLNVWL